MSHWFGLIFRGIVSIVAGGLAVVGVRNTSVVYNASSTPPVAVIQATTTIQTEATTTVSAKVTTTLSEIDQLKLELEQEKAARLKLEKKIQQSQVTSTKTTSSTKDSVSVPSVSTNQSQTILQTNIGPKVLSSEEIYSLVSPSVVLINRADADYQYAGSGFVINDGKYTLTNAHVVGDSPTVQVKLQNGTSFTGIVLGKDDSKDLALLFNLNQRPPAVALGSSGDSLKIGTDVYALGYPDSLNGLLEVTFTKGTLSARQNVSWYPSGTLLQMDAAINHGNSGGPLVNNKGEVVGINTFGLNNTQGIYFAVPIQTAIDLIPTLSQYGQSRYEVYPIGSTMTMNRSMEIQVDLNSNLPCEQLGFKDQKLTLCNLYRGYKNDYSWVIVEDVPHY